MTGQQRRHRQRAARRLCNRRLGVFNVARRLYSFDDIDASRGIFFPGFTDQTEARFHGNVGQVFGEVGYGMTFNHLAVEPMAGLAYVHQRNGSFLESGGAAVLSVSSTHENIGDPSLGVRMATFMPLANGTVLVPRATFPWLDAFGDALTPSGGARVPGNGHCVHGCQAFRLPATRRWSRSALTGASAPGRSSVLPIRASLPRTRRGHAIKGAFTWDF